MPTISTFNCVKDHKSSGKIDFVEYLEGVKNGKWQDVVLDWRVKYPKLSKDKKNDEKAKIPCVTPCGTFEYCTANRIEKHSGIIAMDFDAKENPTGIPKETLAADPYTMALHDSVSGNGIVIYVKIEPEKHLDAFEGLSVYYLNNYEVVADKSCKDVSRLRYVSYDPDLYYTEKSKVFKKYLPKKEAAEQRTTHYHVQGKGDFDFVVEQIVKKGICINDCYDKTYRIGLGIAREYGEAGREAFHAVCSQKPGYDFAKYDKRYSGFVRDKGRGATIGTFYHFAKEAGIDIKLPETKQAETVAKVRRATIGQNGGCKDIMAAKESALRQLKEMDGLEGEHIEAVVDKVMAAPIEEAKKIGEGDIFQQQISFVESLNLKFNEVTRCVEWNGNDLTDQDINTIYRNAKTALGKSVVKSDLESIIFSDTPKSYHPFKSFFNLYSNLKPIGMVEKLMSCFTFAQNDHPQYSSFIQDYILKWLISVVAQMNGTYSIMCLVLVSHEQKINKTKFFRGLLPEELQKYYAESDLAKDKDSDLLMARKLIVMNDEFAGMNKADLERFKALLDKKSFTIRRPYGKMFEELPRYAVICGTSNNEEVIPDVKNRRIIPVNIIDFDFEKYKSIDKVMLWMELYQYWMKMGDDWMLSKEDIAVLKTLTGVNRQVTQEEEAINMFFKVPVHDSEKEIASWLTNTEIKVHIELQTRLKINSTKLGMIMKELGYEKKDKKVNGQVSPRYFVLKLQY